MKKILILLFSIFFIGSPSVFADDISDFSVEGISIGDSLLDYMTEEEILKEIEISLSLNSYDFLNEPFKYLEVYSYKDFPTYDRISFMIKNNYTNQYVTDNNEKYTIVYIAGHIDYPEDFDSCIQKRNEIVEVLSKMFSNAQKKEHFYKSNHDPSEKSIVDEVSFDFDSGNIIGTYCTNYDETFRIKNNIEEGLTVQIKLKEIYTWLDDY
jgi:hypothetical protein